MKLAPGACEEVAFGTADGLLPAIVQHADTGAVLMLAWMNREALRATLEAGRVTFFSRSRGQLWEKGATSGNTLDLVAVHTDCDRDALLVLARPRGPACHLGTRTCFGDDAVAASERLGFLAQLEDVIADRASRRDEASYTARLLASGRRRVAQKVGEEAVEVTLAATAGSDQEVVAESADLLYHLLVLLRERGIALARVVEELEARHRAPHQP
jgi:phosphoribosyl-AMP cyclohydrolase / phosphoribosyl-ATP pyrophosphohydrolase